MVSQRDQARCRRLRSYAPLISARRELGDDDDSGASAVCPEIDIAITLQYLTSAETPLPEKLRRERFNFRFIEPRTIFGRNQRSSWLAGEPHADKEIAKSLSDWTVSIF